MTTTSETPTLQQAFEAAKAEHSENASEQARAAEASTAAEPSTPAQDTDTAAGAPPDTATEPNASDLISETDWTAFSKLDPAKQRAELNKRWTQKTQELAAQRKAIEPHAELIKALQTDLPGTVRQLAQQAGLTVAPKPEEKAAVETAASIADASAEAVKQALGPELDFLAGPLTKAIQTVAEQVAKTVAAQAVKPLEEQTSQIVSHAATEQVKAIEAAFAQKHPDWKQYEPRMVELGQTMQPGPGMTELDYLESLYKLASFDDQIAAAGKKAVVRLAKGAEDAEREPQSVKETQVQKTPPANATLSDAFAAAKRGERWE